MSQDLVQSALIVIPKNTIGAWKSEFDKWIAKSSPDKGIYLDDLDETASHSRVEKVKRFMNCSGPRILLVSHSVLDNIADHASGVDMVVIDECHIVLKNTSTLLSKAAERIRTKLRIGLTGTPIANNLTEYYNMMQFIRPNVLGSYDIFDSQFISPIASGMPKDCTKPEKDFSEQKSAELFKLLKPFVHRKDASQLARDLPPLTQVVLHLCPR